MSYTAGVWVSTGIAQDNVLSLVKLSSLPYTCMYIGSVTFNQKSLDVCDVEAHIINHSMSHLSYRFTRKKFVLFDISQVISRTTGPNIGFSLNSKDLKIIKISLKISLVLYLFVTK